MAAERVELLELEAWLPFFIPPAKAERR